MLSLSKNYANAPVSAIIEETGDVFMEGWRKDARHEPIIVDLEALVPTERGKEIYAMRKQPLSVFLRMQKKNMPCAIHTTEV